MLRRVCVCMCLKTLHLRINCIQTPQNHPTESLTTFTQHSTRFTYNILYISCVRILFSYIHVVFFFFCISIGFDMSVMFLWCSVDLFLLDRNVIFYGAFMANVDQKQKRAKLDWNNFDMNSVLLALEMKSATSYRK